MSYYIRYVLTDDRAVTLAELEEGLQEVDPDYTIDGDMLKLGDRECGIIDVTYPGEPTCKGDLEVLARLARKKKNRQAIMPSLGHATGMVTVQPVDWALDETVFDVIEPLWDWLLENRAGILAVEGGHFFDRDRELK